MYYIAENVYLVHGKVNAAFYDLNSGRLFHVNEAAKNLIVRATTENTFLNDEEQKYIDSLINLKLLTNHYTKKHFIEELKEDPQINFVWIEITTACNLKCIHCYNEADNHGLVMSYDDFCRVIDELTANGIRKIQIIGGEPFTLGKNLLPYLEYTRGKFDHVEIFTNGTLLNEKWAEYLNKNNISVSVSIYSYLPDQHDKVTGFSGSWEKANKNIRLLKDKEVPCKVKNVLMKDIKLGERNTDLYELSRIKDVVRMTGRARNFLLSNELISKRLITKETFSHRIMRQFVALCVSGHNCFSRRLYFSSELDIYPCVMERRISHGNLRRSNLHDVINQEIRRLNKDKIQGCCECAFRYCCFDCRPDANGRELYAKTWYCTYNPEVGKWCARL